MAADSRAAFPRPERSLTVFRTFLTQPQNFVARRFDLVCAIYLGIENNLSLPFRYARSAVKSSNSHKG